MARCLTNSKTQPSPKGWMVSLFFPSSHSPKTPQLNNLRSSAVPPALRLTLVDTGLTLGTLEAICTSGILKRA